MRSWFRHDEIEAFVAERDATLVGYGDRWSSKERNRLRLELHVTEADAGAALLRELERATALAPGARATAGVSEEDDTLRGVFEAAGYALDRHTFRMAVSLHEAVPAELPEWVEVGAYEPEHEAEIHAVHQEAFSELADHTPLSLEEWRTWFVESPGFDPSLWFVAWDGADVAGIALCQVHWSGVPTHGHVNVLAVKRPWRGRGLGAALLTHAFEEMKRRGMTRATLGVDANNATGAVRLYERVGMHVERRHDVYRKELS
ncbi:MAG: GNAT family N-acetyltransferase [Gaiellaceae bacterium]